MQKIIITISITLIAVLVLTAGTCWAATYYVRPGDTLFLIGKKFGVDYRQLQAANNLKTTMIYPGQTLIIPASNAAACFNYTVKPGDALYLIGKRFGVSYSRIMSLNGLWNDKIYPGQVLKIPRASTAPISRGGISWRDLELMARVVNGEARGESFIGQVAVAAVILNRVKSHLFPNTVPGVIYQPWAFTALYDGQVNSPLLPSAYNAVIAALRGWDPTGGALYYWNPITATNPWVWTRSIITKIGNHIFAK